MCRILQSVHISALKNVGDRTIENEIVAQRQC